MFETIWATVSSVTMLLDVSGLSGLFEAVVGGLVLKSAVVSDDE